MLQLSYAPLWATLNDTGMKKIDLIGIVSNSALRKIENEDPVSLKVIGQLWRGWACLWNGSSSSETCDHICRLLSFSSYFGWVSS